MHVVDRGVFRCRTAAARRLAVIAVLVAVALAGQLLAVRDRVGASTVEQPKNASGTAAGVSEIARFGRAAQTGDSRRGDFGVSAQVGSRPMHRSSSERCWGGRLTQTDTLGGTLHFSYNAAGEQTSATDPGGHTRTTNINVGGAATTVTAADALGRAQTMVQDAAGRTTTRTDARGLTTSYLYFLDGREKSETRQEPGGGTTTVGYTYDTAGRRQDMTDPTGTTRWGHDLTGRTSSVTQRFGAPDAKTVGYTFDGAGRRKTMAIPAVGAAPGGTVTYGYDTAGRLASISNPSTGPPTQNTTFGYLLDGRTDTITRPNGVQTSHHYDTAGRLDGITHRNGAGSELQHYAYGLDPNGNRTAMRWSVNGGPETSETYTLDQLSRLTGVDYGDGQSETFGYNADGTRSKRTATGGSSPGDTNYHYDDAQQLTGVDGTAVPGGSTTFGYDNNGNLTTTSAGDRFDYNAANQLTQSTVDGQAHTATFDGAGVRVDSDGHAQISDRTGGLAAVVSDDKATYTHSAGGPLSSTSSAGTSYSLGDELSSVRGTTEDARQFMALVVIWQDFGRPGTRADQSHVESFL